MENWDVLEGGKKRPAVRRQRKAMEILRIVMIVLIILMVLFFFARLLSERSGAGEQTVDGEHYIYQIDADSVLDMKCCNGGLAVLTSNSVLYVSRSGAASHYNGHNYSTPAMCVSDDRVLLYDRGGKNYRIENENGILYDSETDAPIITAALGDKKNYALALKTADTQSSLVVFNQKFNLAFQWQCASEYIVSVDLSDNGKGVAAAVMSAEQAAVYSKVHLFHLNGTEPYASYDFDYALMSVDFMGSSMASILGDNGVSFADKAECILALDLTASEARRYAMDRSGKTMALLLTKYGSEQASQLKVFDRRGNETFSRDLPETANWITVSSRYVAAAYEDRTEVYNFSGDVVGSIVSNDAPERILIDGGSIYILSANGISVYSTTAHVAIDALLTENTTVPETASAADDPLSSTTGASTLPPVAVFTEEGTTVYSAEG